MELENPTQPTAESNVSEISQVNQEVLNQVTAPINTVPTEQPIKKKMVWLWVILVVAVVLAIGFWLITSFMKKPVEIPEKIGQESITTTVGQSEEQVIPESSQNLEPKLYGYSDAMRPSFQQQVSDFSAGYEYGELPILDEADALVIKQILQIELGQGLIQYDVAALQGIDDYWEIYYRVAEDYYRQYEIDFPDGSVGESLIGSAFFRNNNGSWEFLFLSPSQTLLSCGEAATVGLPAGWSNERMLDCYNDDYVSYEYVGPDGDYQ